MKPGESFVNSLDVLVHMSNFESQNNNIYLSLYIS